MRIAAMDVSKNRIGIVISDEAGDFIAYDFLIDKKSKNWKKEFTSIFEKYKPGHTLVGVPLFFDGPSKNLNYIKIFTHGIRQIISPYTFVSEFRSTKFAERYNSDPKKTDIIAASLIFEVGKQVLKNNNIIK